MKLRNWLEANGIKVPEKKNIEEYYGPRLEANIRGYNQCLDDLLSLDVNVKGLDEEKLSKFINDNSTNGDLSDRFGKSWAKLICQAHKRGELSK